MQRSVGIGYGFEVVGHLLWAYAVMIVVWSVLSGLFFLVISGGKIDIVRDTLIAFAAPSFFFATVHVFIFAAFRYYFLPRFPNRAPELHFRHRNSRRVDPSYLGLDS